MLCCVHQESASYHYCFTLSLHEAFNCIIYIKFSTILFTVIPSFSYWSSKQGSSLTVIVKLCIALTHAVLCQCKVPQSWRSVYQHAASLAIRMMDTCRFFCTLIIFSLNMPTYSLVLMVVYNGRSQSRNWLTLLELFWNKIPVHARREVKNLLNLAILGPLFC